MTRVRSRSLTYIALVAAPLLLAGCSSDGDSGGKDTDRPAASSPADDAQADQADPGKGVAHLTYSGSSNGEFTIKSVGCAVLDGKLVAITAPDVDDTKTSTPPAFTAGLTGKGAMTTLLTPDKKSYAHTSATGITGKKTDGKWGATLSGVKLGSIEVDTDPVLVKGTITCGHVNGS